MALLSYYITYFITLKIVTTVSYIHVTENHITKIIPYVSHNLHNVYKVISELRNINFVALFIGYIES